MIVRPDELVGAVGGVRVAEFDRYGEALDACRNQIATDVTLAADVRDLLLEHTDAFVEERHAGGPGWGSTQQDRPARAAGLLVDFEPSAFTGGRRKYYVVRNDHLKLLATIVASGQAILSYATATVPNPVTLSASLLVGTVTVALSLFRKGIALEEDDFRILMLLKQFGPQTTDDLSAMLDGVRGQRPGSLSPDEVRKHLEKLKTIGTPDGKYDSLVVLTDGRWDQNGL